MMGVWRMMKGKTGMKLNLMSARTKKKTMPSLQLLILGQSKAGNGIKDKEGALYAQSAF